MRSKKITIRELCKRYAACMSSHSDTRGTLRARNAAHRQACEIGEFLFAAGYGPRVDIPENTAMNLEAAEYAGISSLPLTDVQRVDLTRRRWL